MLDESALAVRELVPIATERSLGTEVEFRGGVFPVETELAALRGCDLAFLCAPAEASLEAVRALLHARVAAIDCSGALAAAPEVPLVGELGVPGAPPLDAPMLAVPPGLALACTRVLAPLAREFGVSRVVATLLLSASASGAGRAAVEALAEETIALLTQQEIPDDGARAGIRVAFDVLPWIGSVDDDGTTAHERGFAAVLGRALGGATVAVTSVRIPTFCGDGAALAIETRERGVAGGRSRRARQDPRRRARGHRADDARSGRERSGARRARAPRRVAPGRSARCGSPPMACG